jgi:hypothetical protein
MPAMRRAMPSRQSGHPYLQPSPGKSSGTSSAAASCCADSCKEPEMSDLPNSRARRYRNLNDPAYGTSYEPAAIRADNWGWIAAVLCMAVIVIIAFAVGRERNRITANDLTPPAALHPWVPAAPAPNRP